MKTLQSLGDLAGKRVLVRADFNVPLSGAWAKPCAMTLTAIAEATSPKARQKTPFVPIGCPLTDRHCI